MIETARLRLRPWVRADLDFHHPRSAADDATGAMVVYLLERPR